MSHINCWTSVGRGVTSSTGSRPPSQFELLDRPQVGLGMPVAESTYSEPSAEGIWIPGAPNGTSICSWAQRDRQHAKTQAPFPRFLLGWRAATPIPAGEARWTAAETRGPSVGGSNPIRRVDRPAALRATRCRPIDRPTEISSRATDCRTSNWYTAVIVVRSSDERGCRQLNTARYVAWVTSQSRREPVRFPRTAMKGVVELQRQVIILANRRKIRVHGNDQLVGRISPGGRNVLWLADPPAGHGHPRRETR